MRSDEAIYLAARVALAVLWLAAAAAAVRYGMARRRRDAPGSMAPRLAWAATAMLLLGVLLSAIDVRHNLLTAAGQPIPGANWFWLLLDGLTPVFALLLLRALTQRDAAQARLEVAALTDPLTGLPNRRAFLDQAHRVIASARRPRGCPLSLLLLDIDLFKTVNDRFGHGAGDLVLCALAAVLRDTLRRGDLPVRWGGEEFAVLLPATELAEAVVLAERIRRTVPEALTHPGEGRITVSIGVAAVDRSLEPEPALDIALRAADAAMYRAKELGRDRVVVAGEGAAPSTLAAA